MIQTLPGGKKKKVNMAVKIGLCLPLLSSNDGREEAG